VWDNVRKTLVGGLKKRIKAFYLGVKQKGQVGHWLLTVGYKLLLAPFANYFQLSRVFLKIVSRMQFF
jgi:hypothetical protein